MQPERRAVVRSTLPEAEAVLSAVMRTRLPGAVRSEVRSRSAGAPARAETLVRRVMHRAVRRPVDSEADTGDVRSAAVTSAARSDGARMTRPEFGIVSGRNARRGGLFAKRSAE